MRNVLHSRSFKVLLGIVFVVLGIMTYSAGAEGGSVSSSLLGHVFASMQKVSAVISNSAAASVGHSAGDLEDENQGLKGEVDALHARLINYYQVRQEDSQYRTFLELKNENRDFTFVSSSVVRRDSNDVFDSFTMDKGSLAGVATGSPTITESGVVGWASNVSSTFCQVTTLFSPDTNMVALGRVNRGGGVVSGSIKLYEQSYMKLDYLSSEVKVQKDDVVVTSGLDGIYPKNLPVDRMVSVGPEEYSVSYVAIIEPFVDPKTVRDVFIIANFLGKEEALSSLPGPSGTPSGGSTSSSSGATSSGTTSDLGTTK